MILLLPFRLNAFYFSFLSNCSVAGTFEYNVEQEVVKVGIFVLDNKGRLSFFHH